MTKKLFLSGIIGAIVYFLLGWLFYGILFTENTSGEESMLFIGLGCLFYAFIYATIFSRWANITTFSAGLRAGAILGLLYALSWYFFFVKGDFDYLNFIKEILINIAMSAILGSVIAYVIGKVS